MQINLFDLIENLFIGIVFFLYNVVESVWQVLRRPFHGPLRLYRGYRIKGRRQIGPLTFLFLLFAAFCATSTLNINRSSEMLLSSPRFDSEGAWPIILGSLIAAVIVDGSIRLMLRMLLPTRRERRLLILGAFEYALLWPMIGLVIWFAPLTYILRLSFETIPLLIFAGMLVFGASTWPPASVLAAGVRTLPRNRGDPTVRTGRPGVGRTLLASVVVSVLFLAASWYGLMLGLHIYIQREEANAAPVPLSPTALRCVRLPDARISVDLVLLNTADRPTTFEPADLVMELTEADFSGTIGADHLLIAPGSEYPPIVVMPPRGAASFQLVTEGALPRARGSGAPHCRVFLDSYPNRITGGATPLRQSN